MNYLSLEPSSIHVQWFIGGFEVGSCVRVSHHREGLSCSFHVRSLQINLVLTLRSIKTKGRKQSKLSYPASSISVFKNDQWPSDGARRWAGKRSASCIIGWPLGMKKPWIGMMLNKTCGEKILYFVHSSKMPEILRRSTSARLCQTTKVWAQQSKEAFYTFKHKDKQKDTQTSFWLIPTDQMSWKKESMLNGPRKTRKAGSALKLGQVFLIDCILPAENISDVTLWFCQFRQSHRKMHWTPQADLYILCPKERSH